MNHKRILIATMLSATPTMASPILLASFENRVQSAGYFPPDTPVQFLLQVEDEDTYVRLGTQHFWRDGDSGTVDLNAATDPGFALFASLLTNGVDDFLGDGVFWTSPQSGGGVYQRDPESFLLHGSPDLIGNEITSVHLDVQTVQFVPFLFPEHGLSFGVAYELSYQVYGMPVAEPTSAALVSLAGLIIVWRGSTRRADVRRIINRRRAPFRTMERISMCERSRCGLVLVPFVLGWSTLCKGDTFNPQPGNTGIGNLHNGFSLPIVTFANVPEANGDVTVSLSVIANFASGAEGPTLRIRGGPSQGFFAPSGFTNIFAGAGNGCSFPKSGTLTIARDVWNSTRAAGGIDGMEFRLTASSTMPDCVPGQLSELASIEISYCWNCAAGLACCSGGTTCVACCTVGDCDDGNVCTTDTCTSGVC